MKEMCYITDLLYNWMNVMMQ